METFLAIIFIIFGVLQIILFFKMWVMTDNVKEIRDKIVGNITHRPSYYEDQEEPYRKFEDEEHGIIIATGQKVVIYGMTKDGKYKCYSGSSSSHLGQYEGFYDETELEKVN